MTKHAWFNNDYEGKAMRRVFIRLLKRFEKKMNDDNTPDEEIDRITQMLSRVAKVKAELAKPENEYLIRLSLIEQQLGIGRKTMGVLDVKT